MASGPVNVGVALTSPPVPEDYLLDMPCAISQLVYTGVKQSPAWLNYDADKLNISGDISAAEPGTYTTLFTPKENYLWRSDKTQDTKGAVWQIENAKSITVSMEAGGERATVTVSLAAANS